MSTADPTAAELLTAVNAAILALVSAKFKSTTVNDRTYTRQDLPALREMRAELQTEVNATTTAEADNRLGDISGRDL